MKFPETLALSLPGPIQPTISFDNMRLRKMKGKNSAEKLCYRTLLLDLALLLTSFTTAIWWHDSLDRITILHWGAGAALYTGASLLWVIVAISSKVYRSTSGFKLELKVKDLLHAALLFFGMVSLLYYPLCYPSLQAHFLHTAFLTFATSASLSHLLIRRWARNNTGTLSYITIGGSSYEVAKLQRDFALTYGTNVTFLGQFSPDPDEAIEWLGPYRNIQKFLRTYRNQISKVIYLDSDLTSEEIRKLVVQCRNQFLDFEVVPPVDDFFDRGIQIQKLSTISIIKPQGKPLSRINYQLVKRTFDIVFSLLVIIFLLSWIYPIISLLITLESRGPVLFRQQRSGYWTTPFTCLKFRSMTENEGSDSTQAVKGDMRITRLGAFLRRTSLDELPQFFNVLMGDMTVVGPRPHMLQHTEMYSELIEEFPIRHEVKPGITGAAQIKGWRGPTDELYKMQKRVEHDVDYIENWTFWWDMKIIILTALGVFKKDDNAF